MDTKYPDKEIRVKREITQQTFVKIKNFLCSRRIKLDLRLRMLRFAMFSQLYYMVWRRGP